jgi:hypothetical protein
MGLMSANRVVFQILPLVLYARHESGFLDGLDMEQ